jgi:hypothetical protein
MARPEKFPSKRLKMVDPSKFAEVRQHVEDPVVPHHTLIRNS